jgi:predicted branched-subunit amino acid permease
MAPEPSPRGAILRQAASISLAVAPFGVAFGAACSQAGISLIEAIGFSTLVFAGSAQFAAVSVLADGGTAVAAVAAGLLLNLRSLAFGLVMAPALRGRVAGRALASQLVIDESTAIGSAQSDPRWQRFGFLAAGLGVFVLWNLTTVVGASIGVGASDLIDRLGIDATIPAAFAALVWPRLTDARAKVAALGGAAIAFATTPVLPPGLPILAASVAVVALTGSRDR